MTLTPRPTIRDQNRMAVAQRELAYLGNEHRHCVSDAVIDCIAQLIGELDDCEDERIYWPLLTAMTAFSQQLWNEDEEVHPLMNLAAPAVMAFKLGWYAHNEAMHRESEKDEP